MCQSKEVSREFVTAGDAIFTIETPLNGHRTYRVQHVPASDRWPESYFVKLLTGSDNENSYTYMGKLDPKTGVVATTGKSRSFDGSYPLTLVNRIFARIWANDTQAYTQHGFRTHHEGRCGRCGRTLTVPASIESGIGPECAKKMASEVFIPAFLAE